MDNQETQDAQEIRDKAYCEALVARIFGEWKRRGDNQPLRTYLGCSVIGHECDMHLFLSHRGLAKETREGRTYRLFERGRREESLFAKELGYAGVKVWDIETETGRQYSVSALGEHLGGHLDGLATLPENPNEIILVEFKTHANASFRKLVKHGMRKSKPMHYAQMQMYMALRGLTKGLYLAVDKDTDELYAEVVRFDREQAAADYRRVKSIITANSADKCASSESDYRCKMCALKDVCWNTNNSVVSIDVNPCCRNCRYATADIAHNGAKWVCEQDGQSHGGDDCCKRHQFVEVILSQVGEKLTQEGRPSHELLAMARANVEKIDENVKKAADIFGGTIVEIIKGGEDENKDSPLPF